MLTLVLLVVCLAACNGESVDITVTTKPAKFTVTIMAGENVLNTQTVEKDAKVVLPTNVEVLGLFKNPELTEAWNLETDVVTSDLTLYAKTDMSTPDLKTFTVTIVVGEETLATLTVGEGSKVELPTLPENAVGIYMDAELTVEWNAEAEVTSDLTLYVKLNNEEPTPEPTTYTVTVVLAGETVATLEVEKGGKVELPELSVLVAGVYQDSELTTKWDLKNGTVESDLTLYVKPAQEITVTEALEIIATLEASKTTEERYIITATIKSVDKPDYGQMTITDGVSELMVYGTYSADGSKRYKELEEKPVAGDTVTLYANLQNYKGNTPEIYSGWILSFLPNENPPEPPAPVEFPEEGTELTIAQALELCAALEDGEKSEFRYVLRGTVKSIVNPNYGQMIITDGENEISVYGTYSADGVIGYKDMEEKPVAGDTVVVSTLLQNFRGTPELSSTWILSFEHTEVVFDDTLYTAMTVEEARNAEKDALVKLTGVVACITYADGRIPEGFYLVDGTNSIYVHDSQITPQVEVGYTVTICGTKTYWILDTEVNNASKFGYKGCNQIANVTMTECEKTAADFDTSWITESTVKEIMNTPANVDITTTIFKVNALVKKAEGTGFVNYYIDDLDGKTGSYSYTKCSGADFAWLDEFDGKICTVYLSVLNAKSSASGCVWRFIPVKVVDEGFVFDLNNAGEFAVKYHGVDQFESTYTADPALELITEVSSELLGFEGATLTYASSNENVVYFEDGVMHVASEGTCEITITGSLESYDSFSATLTITVEKAIEYDYITVNEAIEADINSIVTVKGIAGPSLVNQVGFYLFAEDGRFIAVKCSTDTMALVELGDEVIVQGKRVQYPADKITDAFAGQACLLDCELLVNSYGGHQLSAETFLTGFTIEDVNGFAVADDLTTQGYILMGKIVFSGNAFQSNVNIYDADNEKIKLMLYTGSAAQYNWLKQFDGQVVTMEVALVSWNKRDFYRGCILAVVLEDGTKIYNELNYETY